MKTDGEVSDKTCLWSEEEFLRRPCFSAVLQFFALRVVQENQKPFHLEGTHQLLIHAEEANLWDEILNDLVILYYTALCYTVLQHNTGRFIMYSGITKIYYRKTVGHVFTKPVKIEGTTQFPPPVSCFSS